MIVGIGTDLCDTGRLAKALARHGDAFARKILGDDEWAIYQDRVVRAPERGLRFLGTRFAAKEAFSKAIGLGMVHPMGWHSCQLLNEESGQPAFVLGGDLAYWFNEKKWRAHVSVSDEGAHALAFVLIETV
ncbi:holo-ACP synthase [Aquabacterium sp.]|uniref:holo-ACP synthase n=1 Tax=Aquabacterium sp. TaxID=1872578 RepID=UPI002E2F41E1|nr:holo-ACP synthase [Aquabacterium sp.]HEX5312638.1 holo-ACP synthase [Aquabacterium sp.]